MADEISVVDHCVLLNNPKTIERLGLLSQPLILNNFRIQGVFVFDFLWDAIICNDGI